MTLEQAREQAVACTLCGGQMDLRHQVSADARRRRSMSRADVHWCAGCDYGSVQPVPNERAVAQSYQFDGYYTHSAQPHVRAGRAGLADRLRVHLAWRLDRGQPTTPQSIHDQLPGPASRICDIGCGSGRLAAGLAERGHHVVGVEVDPAAVAHRRRETFEVYAGTAEHLPREVRRQRFDAVILSHVLEHCRHPRTALRNVRKLLHPGGMLICEVPNNQAAGLAFSGPAWSMFDVPRHLHFFTPSSLHRACEQAGLQVRRTYFAHYTRQFTNEWIKTERELWGALNDAAGSTVPEPTCNSRLRAWRLLLRTMAASSACKYDSVGVIAHALA